MPSEKDFRRIALGLDGVVPSVDEDVLGEAITLAWQTAADKAVKKTRKR